MRPLAVCMLAYEFPQSLDSAVVSGEVKNPYHLMRGLTANGHEVTVVSVPFLTRSPSVVTERPGVGPPVYDVPEGSARGAVRYLWRIGNVARFLATRIGGHIDIIHAQSPALALAAARAKAGGTFGQGAPIVTTAHGTNLPEADADRDDSLRQRLRRANARLELQVDRHAFRGSDAVIAVSRFQEREMLALYKVDPGNVHVIHNGVDRDLYHPQGASAPATEPVILFVGRLVPKKGVQHLISALPRVFSALPQARCIVVGGSDAFDSYGATLHSLVAEAGLGDRVQWLKDVPERDLPGVYRQAAVCVFPSVNYESLPTVALEAMACGVPVIATDRWGTPEALGDAHPGLVGENDPEGLALRIIEMLSGPHTADAVRQHQLGRIPTFDLHATVAKHEELYAHVCGNG